MAIKKLLIITYHFPPNADVGSIRPAKYAKYLREFGWSPFILTIKDKYYDRLDRSKLDELGDNIIIYRTIKLPNIRDIYLKIKYVFAKIMGKERELEESILKDKPQEEKRKVRTGIRSTIFRIVNSIFIWLPDDKLGWVPVAVIMGLYIVKKEKIDAILTTSPPHSVHLIGLLLKIFLKVKWVADFRDPWMIDFKKYPFARTSLSDDLEARMEQKVVQKADWVISTTERLTKRFIMKYSCMDPNKFTTIFNGFDLEDVSQPRGVKKYSKFTITHTGTFYLGRTPEPILRAISELVFEKRILRENFVIQFIGNSKYYNGISVAKVVTDFGLTPSVHIKDWIPYKEALKEMAKSHVLLLLAPGQPLQIPAKAFEYIGMNANILAILDDGATADLLKNYKKAIIISESDNNSLKEAILSFYRNHLKSNDQKPENFSNLYERRFLTQNLANLLNSTYAKKINNC